MTYFKWLIANYKMIAFGVPCIILIVLGNYFTEGYVDTLSLYVFTGFTVAFYIGMYLLWIFKEKKRYAKKD